MALHDWLKPQQIIKKVATPGSERSSDTPQKPQRSHPPRARNTACQAVCATPPENKFSPCPVCAGNLFNESKAGGYFCVTCQPLPGDMIKATVHGQVAATIEAIPCDVCACDQYKAITAGWLCSGCGQVIDDETLRLFCRPRILQRGYMPKSRGTNIKNKHKEEIR